MTEERRSHTATTASESLGAAFAALQVSLRNYLRRRVSDPALVEDLLQEIFVKASAAISADRTLRNLPAWLYTAARTTVIDYYRSARHEHAELDENLPDTPGAFDEILHRELATCLRPLVQSLPPIYRDTLLAIDFEGKAMKVLADEQGVSLSAIKSRASRGRSMLKAKLLDCCYVEMSGGLVTDYQRRSSNSRCKGQCEGRGSCA